MRVQGEDLQSRRGGEEARRRRRNVCFPSLSFLGLAFRRLCPSTVFRGSTMALVGWLSARFGFRHAAFVQIAFASAAVPRLPLVPLCSRVFRRRAEGVEKSERLSSGGRDIRGPRGLRKGRPCIGFGFSPLGRFCSVKFVRSVDFDTCPQRRLGESRFTRQPFTGRGWLGGSCLLRSLVCQCAFCQFVFTIHGVWVFVTKAPPMSAIARFR
jgi:hypothetical protein